LNGGNYRAGVTFGMAAKKDPQGNPAIDDTLRDISASGAGSGQQSLQYGTGSGKIDTLVSQARWLAAGSSETFDLFAGTTLLDLFGDSGAMRTVKGFGIYILPDTGDSSGVRIGGGSQAWAGAWSGTATVYPDGPPPPRTT
jgi:hypothetical protein